MENIWDSAPHNLKVVVRMPGIIPESEESLEFHAARLLLLLYHSKGKTKRIEGRTKLAKLDFLVRYPAYLIRAAGINKVVTSLAPLERPESLVIRYKYGPWDTRYYDIFAYMVAKDFVNIESSRSKGDLFLLTAKGQSAAEELTGPEFDDLADRCKLAHELFGHSSGSAIKTFIYRNFSEVINRPLGTEIIGSSHA